jgi:hypothetical protein
MNSSICIKLYDIYSEFVLGYLTYVQCLKLNLKDERNYDVGCAIVTSAMYLSFYFFNILTVILDITSITLKVPNQGYIAHFLRYLLLECIYKNDNRISNLFIKSLKTHRKIILELNILIQYQDMINR